MEKRLNPNTPPRPADIEKIPEPSHPTKTSRRISYVAAAALVVIALGLARILTWSLDNSPVLEIYNSPFPTRTIREHPTANGVVFLDVDYCKHREITGSMRMSFLNHTSEVFLPMSEERGPKKCQRTEIPVSIPKDISPGIYKVKFRVTYDKNPLKQNEVVEFESQEFEIVQATQ